MKYETIKDAALAWVGEFNAIPQGMIEKLMQNDIDEWNEVTMPAHGDRVYHFEEGESGEITKVIHNENKTLYEIKLDNDETVQAAENDFEVEYDSLLPMWSTMWSFGDSADDYWLTDCNGIQIMSECGFRVYESDDFGYFFGIDGAGYDFYEEHWIPLYKARGLHWHKTEWLKWDDLTDEEKEQATESYICFRECEEERSREEIAKEYGKNFADCVKDCQFERQEDGYIFVNI